MVCHYWFFNLGLKFQDYVCNGCQDLIMLCLNISNIATITVIGADNCCITHEISKSEGNNLLQNSVLDDRGYKMYAKKIIITNQVCNCYFNNLIKARK